MHRKTSIGSKTYHESLYDNEMDSLTNLLHKVHRTNCIVSCNWPSDAWETGVYIRLVGDFVSAVND